MIVTAEQMKRIEQNAMDYSLSMERLMENAGSAAAATIRKLYDVTGKNVTIFCGRGNNGGDGFVVGRRLTEAGAGVMLVLTDGEPRTEQAREMYQRVQYMDLPIMEYGEDPAGLTERLARTDLLVDAVYGSGFHGNLDEKHRDICRLMTGVGAPVISLDIPSGVCADTGVADTYAVQARYTVVFDSDKPATMMPSAERFCGEVILADIGIPAEAHDGIEERYTRMESEFVFSRLRKRVRETHKGDYGKLLVVGGSQRYMGAVVLAVLAAMRTGAGYVTLASTKEVCRTTLARLPEAVMLPLRQTPEGGISAEALDTILSAVKSSTAILVGNGLGMASDAEQVVRALCQEARCPLILDADGINLASKDISMIQEANCPVVLTPHMKELSRLTGLPVEQLKQDPVGVGEDFAKKTGATVVVKDAYSLTVTPDGHVYINTTGNAGMAKAGSGDVLAGIIGSLAAQGQEPSEAAACGVWLHGLAGDYAARNRSQYGMLARDIIDGLCEVFYDYDR